MAFDFKFGRGGLYRSVKSPRRYMQFNTPRPRLGLTMRVKLTVG